ncbi:GerMN domain-containing protein [Paenibacillus sp. DMB20]|uniref:GerMN domain-containing protein n=1 Tax=Paenibacillus sp. DMB20 TaxID=1642570 RepID=UPI0006278487|nr:hypothetical protein XI25_20520 [Paenibacillus sp. DMB20]
MNKKYWAAGLLTIVLALAAGCGQKPAAAPSEPPQNTAGQVQTPGTDQAEPTPEEKETDTVANTNPTEPDTNVNAEKAGTETQVAATDPKPPEKSTEPQPKKAHIKMYYTDPELMELKEADGEITYTDDKDKYAKSFQALQKSSNEQLQPLWMDSIKLNSVKFENGALTLDITKPQEANLGSGGEMFAIEALRNMFFQYDEVKSIELLVDGKQVESLMGHVDLEHPMTR